MHEQKSEVSTSVIRWEAVEMWSVSMWKRGHLQGGGDHHSHTVCGHSQKDPSPRELKVDLPQNGRQPFRLNTTQIRLDVCACVRARV